MSNLIKMAFRNVFRFKRRTGIALSAISIGLALLIVSICLLDGVDRQSIANIVNSQTGYLTVFREGYFEKKDDLPVGITIPDPVSVLRTIEAVPGVKSAERRVLFSASLIKGADDLPCLGVGIEPDRDPGIFNIRQSLETGRWLKPGESGILVGRDLAKDVGLVVGDRVALRLVTSDREEEVSWNAIDAEVAGIFSSGNPAADGQTVIMPLTTAQEGLGLGTAVTEIAVRLSSNPADMKSLGEARVRIRAALGPRHKDLRVYTWEDLAGIFKTISAAKKKNTLMIILIILFVAAMGIVNTMLMAVFERTRELGMLAALGMRRPEILGLIVMEGGFIGVFGSLLGCFLGGLGGWYLQVKGLSMTALAGEEMAKIAASIYPLKNVFYGELSVHVLAQTFLLGTLVSVAASFYPAWKATRLNPIEALRHI